MKKHLLLKTFLFLAFLIWANVGWVNAQVAIPHYDGLDYTVGQALQTQTGWTAVNTGDDLLISSESLSYNGLPTSTGNKVAFGGSGIDAGKVITSQTSGTVYYSFIMKVTGLNSLNATGGYFTGFGQNNTTFGATIWTGLDGAGYKIGINPRTSTSTNMTWVSGTQTLNDTIFVVVSYQFNSSTGDDIAKIWINPSSTTFGAGSAPIESASVTNLTGTDLTGIAQIFIRQDSDTETPFIEMDELRIGTTWADVAPKDPTAPPVATWDPTNAATAIEPSTAITITFDEAIRDIATDANFDNTTVDALITTFETVVGSTPVTFDATIDGTNQIITITPSADLAFNTEYTITLAAVEDISNNATSIETITFTTKPETDKDSKVIDPIAQIPAYTVESILADSIPVFSFTISDLGTVDGIDTKVTQITLKAGANNTVSFTDNFSGGYLISETGVNIPFGGEPVITATSITIPFAIDALTIPDGEDSTYTVCLLLGTTVEDGSIIQMMIDGAAHGFVADATGSEFATDFGADVVGNEITVNVTATDLNFFSEPVNVYVGNDIEPSVKVTAIDINGNVDVDYITDISLTATGATLVGSPVSATPVMGKATFSSVAFSNAATGVTLTAASGTLTEKVSETFDVLAVPSTDLFISEYVEPVTGNNKVIEIYNPTGANVDLSNYVIKQSYNGEGWGIRGGVSDTRYVLPLSGTLAAGEVFVIATSDATFTEITTNTDLALTYNSTANGAIGSNVASFTSNDAIGLFKTDVLIDAIGIELVANGAGPWAVASVSGASQDHTLLRKLGTTHGTIDWNLSAGTTAENSEWKVFNADFVGNVGAPTPDASSETAITDITFGSAFDLEEAVINDGTSTIDITVINGTDVTALVPTITLSDGATVDPLSGVAQNFTSPVVYTVTAEDGITTEAWTVTVTVSATLSTYANILTFVIPTMTNVEINEVDTTITVDMPYGTNASALTPTFTISAGANVDIASGLVQNFTTPFTYTVTAQNSTNIMEWEVSVVVAEIEEVTIHDIQYTTATPADSPFKGQQILTSGIVTGTSTSGFFIQNGNGEWNGVYVYNNTVTRTVGDLVEFAALVDEYYNLTELKTVTSYSVLSQGNTLPVPASISIANAGTEAYEGVLVSITNAECTVLPNSYGEWTVSDGTNTIIVDDVLFAFTPVLGTNYNITGIVDYTHSAFKLYPRNASDITEATGINNPSGFVTMNIYPNPSNGQFTLELNAQKAGTFNVEIVNISGQVVFEKQIVQDGISTIDISNRAKGMYYIRINDGTSVNVQKIVIQ